MPYIEDPNGNRFLLGIHRGIVVDRDDKPTVSRTPHRGRIKVKIPFLNTEKDHEFWCDSCLPSHQFFSIPAVGTLVYVMFNGGNPEQPVWLGAVNSTNASKDPPNRFRLDEPDNSGYESLGGHFLEFHDKAGIKHIRLEDSAANYQLFDTELNDWEIFFANDERKDIGRDETRTIGRDVTDTIGRDEIRDITNDQTETIGNDQTLTINNDRTETVANNDSLTVTSGNKTIDVSAGSWDNTVQQGYTLTGQSTADFTFQDTISFTTSANFDQVVTGDWSANITGNTDFTVTGDWTSTITGKTELTGSDDISFEATATKKITLKNSIFQFEIGAATSTWSVTAGTASITMTPASITISNGSAVWTMTTAGVTFTGSFYGMNGIDTISHRHLTFGTPPFTSTWTA